MQRAACTGFSIATSSELRPRRRLTESRQGALVDLARVQVAELPQGGREQQNSQRFVTAGVPDLGNADDAKERAGGQANVGPCRIRGKRRNSVGRLFGRQNRTCGPE